MADGELQHSSSMQAKAWVCSACVLQVTAATAIWDRTAHEPVHAEYPENFMSCSDHGVPVGGTY